MCADGWWGGGEERERESSSIHKDRWADLSANCTHLFTPPSHTSSCLPLFLPFSFQQVPLEDCDQLWHCVHVITGGGIAEEWCHVTFCDLYLHFDLQRLHWLHLTGSRSAHKDKLKMSLSEAELWSVGETRTAILNYSSKTREHLGWNIPLQHKFTKTKIFSMKGTILLALGQNNASELAQLISHQQELIYYEDTESHQERSKLISYQMVKKYSKE